MKKISGIIILVAGGITSGFVLGATSIFGWKGATFTNMDISSPLAGLSGLAIIGIGAYLVMRDKN